MKKVYQVIWTDGYGDYQEMGFFSTKEKAKKFIEQEKDGKLGKDYYIDEYDVH